MALPRCTSCLQPRRETGTEVKEDEYGGTTGLADPAATVDDVVVGVRGNFLVTYDWGLGVLHGGGGEQTNGG